MQQIDRCDMKGKKLRTRDFRGTYQADGLVKSIHCINEYVILYTGRITEETSCVNIATNMTTARQRFGDTFPRQRT
jgi:hypothetical protein